MIDNVLVNNGIIYSSFISDGNWYDLYYDIDKDLSYIYSFKDMLNFDFTPKVAYKNRFVYTISVMILNDFIHKVGNDKIVSDSIKLVEDSNPVLCVVYLD